MLTAIRAPDRRQGVLATVPGNAGRLPQAWQCPAVLRSPDVPPG